VTAYNTAPGPGPDAQARTRAGLLSGFGAYGIWGLLPLYFVLLEPATPVEIVAMRVLFSLVFCLAVLALTGGLGPLGRVLRSPRTIGALTVAGLLVGSNWFLYTVATTTGNTLEASLGYFINPLVAVLLGVAVLRERMRPLQWAAVGVGLAAVVVMAVFYGEVPWLSLGLAFSFGFYGLVKNMVGGAYPAIVTLTVETLALAPVAAAVVGSLAARDRLSLATEGTGHFLLLLSSGVITAVPLILFGVAATRLPLSTVGMIQYVAPIMQFLLAVLVLGERMPFVRWVGFGFVWCAVLLLVLDAVRAPRAVRA
jgi:chloramphenicol-sensitive protein RarD